MKRRADRWQAAKASFAAAVVEHGDWRAAAAATQTPLSTAREWMAQLGQLFRSPAVVASPAGAPPFDGPLLGRDQLLPSILGAFEEQAVRCVSLHGALGVGKTRLAVEAARRMRSSCADILFVSLRGACTHAEVICALAQAISAQGGKVQGTAEAVSAYLRSRDPRGWLLILDDAASAHQILPGLLRTWLSDSAYLEVILTSSAVLRDVSARSIHIAPLHCPPVAAERAEQLESPAIRLFLHRAQQLVPDRNVEARASSISQIVCALDGIPRYIELAAERLPELGFDGVRAALDDPFELLDGHREGGGQDSVRAALENAWRELSPADSEIVGACSVFEGALVAEASEAVAECTSEQARRALHNAVSLGLGLIEDAQGQTGFRLLAVGRALARERALCTRGWSASLERHAGYYGARASAWIEDFGRLDRAQRAEIRRALPDLRAACARAREGLVSAELCLPVVRALAHNTSGAPLALTRSMIEDLFAREAQLPAEGRAGLSLAFGKVLRAQGQLSSAVHHLTVARRLARTLSLDEIRVESLITLARTQLAQRRISRSRRLARQSLAEAQELSSPRLIAEALIGLSHIEMMAGELALARELLDDGLETATEAGLSGLAGQLLNHLGGVAWYAGDAVRAEGDWGASLQLHSELGDEVRGACVTVNLAALGSAGQDPERAVLLATRARPVAHAYGDPVLEHAAETILAGMSQEAGDLSVALVHAEQAVLSVQDTELHKLHMLALAARSAISADLGVLSEARADLRASQAISDSLGEVASHLSLTQAHIALAEAKEAGRRVLSSSSERARAKANEIAGDLSEVDDSLRMATELRVLRKALQTGGDSSVLPAVVVHTDGAWFQLPHSVPVDLSRRPLLGKIVRLLLARRVERPGQAVSVPELFAAAWPVETRSSKQSLRNRLYVAIARLRKLGLEAVLESVTEGYKFSTEIEFEVRHSASERFGN